MNHARYTRLVDAIQTQRLQAVQDALAELRAVAKTFQPRYEVGQNPSEFDLDWTLTNARSEDDLTPMAVLCHLYAMKKTKGDTASCDRLNAIAEWLIAHGADPFLDQARPLFADGRRGTGASIVQTFGRANLPSAVQAAICAVNDSTGEDARILRYWLRLGIAA